MRTKEQHRDKMKIWNKTPAGQACVKAGADRKAERCRQRAAEREKAIVIAAPGYFDTSFIQATLTDWGGL